MLVMLLSTCVLRRMEGQLSRSQAGSSLRTSETVVRPIHLDPKKIADALHHWRHLTRPSNPKYDDNDASIRDCSMRWVVLTFVLTPSEIVDSSSTRPTQSQPFSDVFFPSRPVPTRHEPAGSVLPPPLAALSDWNVGCATPASPGAGTEGRGLVGGSGDESCGRDFTLWRSFDDNGRLQFRSGCHSFQR